MPLPSTLREHRLVPGRPASAQAKRLAADLVAHALTQANADDRVEAIHQVRLVLKGLRALLRLLPDPKTGRSPETLESRLQSLGRELSPTRDRDVAAATLLALAEKRGDAPQQAAARRWAAGLANRAKPTATGVPEIAGALARLRPALARHLAGAARPEALAEGLAHALRKTRRWQRRAVESRAPDAFHAWRRWQKRLETQLRWMSADRGRGTKALLGELHAQQEELGRLHDLDVLAELLRGTPGAGAQRLLALVAARQQRLATRLCDRRRRPLRRLARAVRDARRAWRG